MICSRPRIQSHSCQADSACRRPPRFQARVEAANGDEPIRKNAEACADHLGDMVQELTTWARSRHPTQGQLTVLAIDPAADSATPPAAPGGGGHQLISGLAFSTIQLAE